MPIMIDEPLINAGQKARYRVDLLTLWVPRRRRVIIWTWADRPDGRGSHVTYLELLTKTRSADCVAGERAKDVTYHVSRTNSHKLCVPVSGHAHFLCFTPATPNGRPPCRHRPRLPRRPQHSPRPAQGQPRRRAIRIRQAPKE